jgi:hypothetical protein
LSLITAKVETARIPRRAEHHHHPRVEITFVKRCHESMLFGRQLLPYKPSFDVDRLFRKGDQ